MPEKKYNVPKRTTIGKMDPLDSLMMYPNPNFLKYFPEVELPEEKERSKRSSCLRIGTYVLIRKIIADYGLDEVMKRIIGKDSGLFLDLAAYSIISENNAGQDYHEGKEDQMLQLAMERSEVIEEESTCAGTSVSSHQKR